MLLMLLTERSLVDKLTLASNQVTTNTTPKGGGIDTWGKGVASKKREEHKLILKHESERFEETCELGTKMITQQSDKEHPSINMINSTDETDGDCPKWDVEAKTSEATEFIVCRLKAEGHPFIKADHQGNVMIVTEMNEDMVLRNVHNKLIQKDAFSILTVVQSTSLCLRCTRNLTVIDA
jgi:hypothetical protein